MKVHVGDSVSLGQNIAVSGKSNINHNFDFSLHFEVYDNGNIVDPEKFLNQYKSN